MSTLLLSAANGKICATNQRCRQVYGLLEKHLYLLEQDAPIHIVVPSSSRNTTSIPWNIYAASPRAPKAFEIVFDWSGSKSTNKGYLAFIRDFAALNATAKLLADLINMITSLAPDRQILLTSDGIGAAIVLRSFPNIASPNVTKAFFFQSIEFGAHALRAAKSVAGRKCRMFNFTAPENSLSLWIAERLAPRTGPADQLIGKGMVFDLANWEDIKNTHGEIDLCLEDLGYREGIPQYEHGQIGVHHPAQTGEVRVMGEKTGLKLVKDVA